MSQAFAARYAGRCEACAERFAVGAAVRYEEWGGKRALVHDVCPADRGRELPVCPKCFLVRPCEHDDPA